MAMYHYQLNTFDDVAKHYEDIKPIRGSDNIRPLGDRACKWEQINLSLINKYALLDSLPADALNPIWPEPLHELIKRSPAISTRRPSHGHEQIRIRTHTGQRSTHQQT